MREMEKGKLPIDIQAVIALVNEHPLETRVRVLEKLVVLLVSVLLHNFGSHTPCTKTCIEAQLEIGIRGIVDQLQS